MVSGQWSVVSGQWSVANDPWSVNASDRKLTFAVRSAKGKNIFCAGRSSIRKHRAIVQKEGQKDRKRHRQSDKIRRGLTGRQF